MRIVGHGIDLTSVARIREMVGRHADHFLTRVFTPAEIAYSADSKRRFEHLAARFAAKEAALKALGTGWRDGIAWTDVEVVNGAAGEPTLRVTGVAAGIAARRSITSWVVSLSHTDDTAVASVLAIGA